MEDSNIDILDCFGPGFGPDVKLFSCALCSEKFSNKKKVNRISFRIFVEILNCFSFKITLHWAVNHGYSLCSLCSVSLSHNKFRVYINKCLFHRTMHFTSILTVWSTKCNITSLSLAPAPAAILNSTQFVMKLSVNIISLHIIRFCACTAAQ